MAYSTGYKMEMKHILELICFSTLLLMGICGFWTRLLCRNHQARLAADEDEDDEATQKLREEQTKALLKRHLRPCTKILEADDFEHGENESQSFFLEKTNETTPQPGVPEKGGDDCEQVCQQTDEELGGCGGSPQTRFSQSSSVQEEVCPEKADEELGGLSEQGGEDCEQVRVCCQETDEELESCGDNSPQTKVSAVQVTCLETDEELGGLSQQVRGDRGQLCEGQDEELGSCHGGLVADSPAQVSAAVQEVFSDKDEELGIDPFLLGSTIRLPGNQVSLEVRKAPNLCSICLGSYQTQDNVTWSSNTKCQHVFHHECIFNWLERSTLQFLRKTRRPVDESLFTEPALSCPCCRQVFIESTTENPNGEAVGDNTGLETN